MVEQEKCLNLNSLEYKEGFLKLEAQFPKEVHCDPRKMFKEDR